MGIIRKTASISTLGLINYRSNKEHLERERQRGRQTRKALEKATAEVEDLQARVETADKRATKAELNLLAAEKRRRRWRRASKRRDDVADGAADLSRRARKQIRKEAKQAKKAARKAKDSVVDTVA